MNTGGVGAAARALFTSQPTVSRELAHMEQRLGLQLFDRVRGRLQPTAAAQVLFDEVQRAYIGLERIAHTAALLRQHQGAQVSVLCLPLFAHSLLPQAWASVRARFAQAQLRVTPQESPILEQWLSSQTHDVGLIERNVAPPGTRLQALLQADEVCVVPVDHALASKPVLSLADFEGQPFVHLAPDDPYRLQIDAIFASAGVQRGFAVETPSAVSVCAMVRHGLGLAVVNPLTALEFAGSGLVIRRWAVSVPFQVSLVRPEQRPGNALADELELALLQAATQRLDALVQSFL
jgi:DNA-binding transcriptional LysR family regulator